MKATTARAPAPAPSPGVHGVGSKNAFGLGVRSQTRGAKCYEVVVLMDLTQLY